MNNIRIGKRQVGPGCDTYIIAEAGVNHNGSLDLALEMIDAAHEACADAVKFQAFIPEELVSREAGLVSYQKDTGAATQLEMLRAVRLSPDDFARLAAHARDVGIEFLATPFDDASLDMLVDLGVAAIKIASPDLVHFPLIERAARAGLPLIMSTGAAVMPEVRESVERARKAGGEQIALMHCVSAYPAAPERLNLRAIQTLKDEFACPVGFSDHTADTWAATVAVAFGADIIEKHFTLDRSLPGPDQAFSLEPAGLKRMIEEIRLVAEALNDAQKRTEVIQGSPSTRKTLGDGEIRPDESELETRRLTRRSLVARVRIEKGRQLAREMIAFKRPAGGLAPRDLDWALGKRARQPIMPDEIIKRESLEG